MSDLKETIRRIAEDLTNLEINTIIKNGMTGGKMPQPRHALIQIAQEYVNKLGEIMEEAPHSLNMQSDQDFAVGGKGTYNSTTHFYKRDSGAQPKYVLPGSMDSFDVLRTLASDGLQRLQSLRKTKELSQKQEADVVMLCRIRDMSDQIKGVFHALKYRVRPNGGKEGGQLRVDPKTINSMKKVSESKYVADNREALRSQYPNADFSVHEWDNNYTRDEIEMLRPLFPLTTDELVTIRKAWEIGTEVIVMQTMIQLDGDVVTRIDPAYVTAEKETIRRIHSDSVTLSLKAWDQLIGLVKEFFEDIVKFFLPK